MVVVGKRRRQMVAAMGTTMDVPSSASNCYTASDADWQQAAVVGHTRRRRRRPRQNQGVRPMMSGEAPFRKWSGASGYWHRQGPRLAPGSTEKLSSANSGPTLRAPTP
jgi:hypothetical protein